MKVNSQIEASLLDSHHPFQVNYTHEQTVKFMIYFTHTCTCTLILHVHCTCMY